MRRLPPLNAVRAFEVAARHESFVRAASELHVTHGAISRQVGLLEEWLGLPLFRRGARQVVLTEAGRAFLREAGSAFDKLERAAILLRQSASSVTLSVSATPTFSMHWLIPRLNRFNRRHPDIDIRLSSSLDPIDFSQGNYDIGIRRYGLGSAERQVPLFSAMMMPICSPDLPGAYDLEPAGLAAHTLIHTSTSPSSWPNWLASVDQRGLLPANVLHFDQLYFGVQACINHMGLAIAPAVILIDDLQAGRLMLPFPRDRLPDDTVYHATISEQRIADGPANQFVAWLQEEGQASYEATQALTLE